MKTKTVDVINHTHCWRKATANGTDDFRNAAFKMFTKSSVDV